MGTLSQLVTVVWKELCLRAMLRQGWLSLSECLLAPLLCLVLLLTTGPPFVNKLRDVPISGVDLLDWPCAVVEKQLVFRRVAYAPHAPYSMRLMEATFREFSPVEGLVGFQDPQAVTEFARTKANDSNAFDLVIVFDNLRRTDDKPPEDLRYTLRYNTSRLYLLDDRDDRRGYYPLRRDYVVPLVCLLGDSHLRLTAQALGRPEPRYRWRTRSFSDNKIPRTVVHRDYSALAFQLGVVWLLLNYAADTVGDKRTRHREFRRIMGQTTFVYWFEVLLRGLGPMLASCCGLLFVVTSVPDRFGFSYLQYTDPTVLLTLLYTYALHVLTFVTLVTTFFTSETLVVLATCFAVLISFLPYLLFVEMTFPFRLICCMLPNTALQLAMDIILTFERDMTGMQWDQLNMMLSAEVPSLASVLLVMLLGVSFNVVLALIMDDVLPLSTNTDGPRLFHICASSKLRTPWQVPDPEHELFERSEHRLYEPPGIYVDNVTKVFGHRVVLKNVRLRVYEGEALALLGPNGSGKSTLANIVVGYEAPSGGDVFVCQHSVRQSPRAARRHVGFLPQTCMLFPYMTVSENLHYFSQMTDQNVSSTLVFELLRTFFLHPRRHDLVSELSQGLRKCAGLCVALMAAPKVLVLDDLTSGVDVMLRRRMLKLIKTVKDQCAILITSQRPDELDFVVDKVAILARGVVQCVGSPAFLRDAYAVPYRCRLIRDTTDCRSAFVEAELRECLPHAKLISKAANELLFSLGTRKLLNFGHTFRSLNASAPSLYIRDVGFPYVSLEDVLIRVSYMSGEAMVPPTGGLNVAPGAKVHVARSGSVLWRGLLALLRYRLLHLGRHVVFYTLLLLMGSLLFLVFCDRVASVRTPFPRALPRIPLDPEALRHGYVRSVTETADLAQAVINLGSRRGVKLVKAASTVGDALGAGNFTAPFAFDLGTQALVSWYNVRSRRSEAMSLLLLQNAALQFVSGNTMQRVEAAIEFLPGGASVSPVNVFTWLSDVELKLSGATFVPISLGLFSAAAALFPAVDQADGGRLLQRLSGLPGALYWLSNMFWDYVVLYMLYMLLLSPMVVIWGFGDSIEFWGSVVLLFAAYGWAAIPLAYVLSQLAGPRPSRAFSLAVVVKCVFGVLAVLYVIRLHLSFYVGEEESPSRELLELISMITRMVPTVSISWGLGRAMWLTSLNELCHMDNDADFMQACRILNATESSMHLVRRYWFLVRCCNVRLACMHNVQKCVLPQAHLLTWNPHSVWPEVASLLLAGLLCLAVLCFAETNVWWILRRMCGYQPHLYVTRAPKCLLNEGQKERLVRHFRDKTLPCIDTLVVSHVRQETGPYAPLHDISLCMHRRECLALLGPTGSGRSLLLRILTAQVPVSDGNAHLLGADLFAHSSEFVRALGYASEERDAVGWLTGRQLLRHMARMRRVPPKAVAVVVEQLLRMLDLVEQSEHHVSVYSSGERAKLAVALALVGAPPVVLLDKPTDGLDPVARRRVWHTIITFVKKTHMSVLLATEE
ncbi:phospholipid-transporting ATPase ABCA3-like isoform X2 [Dermacentor albipictus]|uniref:phospholipid-transporting ATPase ABCA3-like isoform X2 n=1 Tax=Dermacentor albipictus TaxID=60249 RepID=UPI0031FCFBAC